jgi:hypothetical protein
MAIVTRDADCEVACEKISAMISRGDGIMLLASAITTANHLYSAVMEWAGMDPGEHCICIAFDDMDADVRGVETETGAIDMIVVYPARFVVTGNNGEKELDVIGIIKRIVYLMLYVDIKLHGKQGTKKDLSIEMLKDLVDKTATNLVDYIKDIIDKGKLPPGKQ